MVVVAVVVGSYMLHHSTRVNIVASDCLEHLSTTTSRIGQRTGKMGTVPWNWLRAAREKKSH